MLSNKLRTDIVINYAEANEWLDDECIDVIYDFLDTDFYGFQSRKWNSKEELIEALEAHVLQEMEATQEVDKEKEEAFSEAIQLETVRQQVLETLEEVQETQVETLNNLYNNSPVVEEEEEFQEYPFWVNNLDMTNWTKEMDTINSIEFPNDQEESDTEVEEIEEESAPLNFISIICATFLILLVVLGVTVKLSTVGFKALKWSLNDWLNIEKENTTLILENE